MNNTVITASGRMLDMKKIEETAKGIINKFADEEMNKQEAIMTLNRVEGMMDEFLIFRVDNSEKEIEKFVDDFIGGK